MFFRTSTFLSLALALTCASSVSAHGVVTAIQGANGKTGVGFGVTDTTGKTTRLFNQASRFVKGDTSLCGSQKLDGKSQTPINEKAEVSKAIAKGLPSVDSTGTLSMTLFQVNADGAGPYNCEVSADGTGSKFVAMQTTTDVPGTKGKSNAANAPFPLKVKMPAGTTCTGTGGMCLVRCKNGNSQPFGGCMAVTSAGAAKRSSVPRLVHEARFHEDALASISARSNETFVPEDDADDVDTDVVNLNP